MRDERIDGAWSVPVGGFVLHGDQLALREPDCGWRRTLPWRDATLCRAFAAISAPADVLAFANTNGSLYRDHAMEWGEPVADWIDAAARVRTALWLLDAASARGLDALRARIEWKPRVVVLRQAEAKEYAGLPRGEKKALALDVLPKSDDPRKAVAWLREGDDRAAARAFAQKSINAGLETGTVARLLRHRGGHVLRIVPATLLGAVWLQVAEVAEGAIQHRECPAPGCKTWFVVAPGRGARPDRRTCSATCRVRLHRAGKASRTRATRRRPRP